MPPTHSSLHCCRLQEVAVLAFRANMAYSLFSGHACRQVRASWKPCPLISKALPKVQLVALLFSVPRLTFL